LAGWLQQQQQQKHALFANSAKAGNLHIFCSLGNVCQKKLPIS